MAVRYEQIDKVILRLGKIRLKSVAIAVASTFVVVALILGVGWILTSLLDLGLGLRAIYLKAISITLMIASIAALGYGLIRVFSISHSLRAYAARIAALEEIGHDFLTALDLAEVDIDRLGYSPILIKRVIDDINRRIERAHVGLIARQRKLVICAIPTVSILIVGLLWMSLDNDSFSYSMTRYGYFLGLANSDGMKLCVEPGNYSMLAGGDVSILAEVEGYSPGQAELHILADRSETAFHMDQTDSATKGKLIFESTLTRIDRDMDYFVTFGDKRSPIYRISVYEKPKIVGGVIRLIYPTYTGRGEQLLPEGIWDITAPYGTSAEFTLKPSCKPDSAWLILSDGADTTRRVMLAEDNDSLTAAIRLFENLSYTVELAVSAFEAEPHGPHSISVVPDDPPYVRIESPQDEMMLEADMIVPLSAVAVDDYGISSMRLYYAAPAGTSSIALEYRGTTQARADMDWDVSDLNLFPGDVVAYWLIVADNDALRGPKYARSHVQTLRVPAIHEIYASIESEQEEDIGALEEVADEATQLKDEIDKLIDDMKRKSDVGWEEEQAIKQNLMKHQELLDRLENISSSLDETLNRMSQNELITFEIIEKIEEIRQLINEVATEELLKAIEQMQQALEQLSPEEIRRAMENFNISQEELLQRLDRTIELLKKMKLQQRMEAVANLAKQITQGQSEINQKLQEGADLKETALEEQGLVDKTEALEQMMDQLADLLKQQGNPLEAEVRKAGDFLRSQDIKGSMSMAMAAMQAGEQSEASEQGKQAESNMAKLSMMLESARASLMGEDKRALMEALKVAINVLRDVSERHEEVLGEIDVVSDTSLVDLARREMVYKEALDKVADHIFKVARKSLFIGPRLGGAVLQISKQLEVASQTLSQHRPSLAKRQGRAALGMMNQLVTALMDAMDQAGSCNSPSGLCEVFKNLENMCAMQMGINAGTRQLQDMGQEGLSMEMRAQMARLAAEQEAVRKGIEDLARETRGRSEILGRLDDLAEEARKVVDDLKQQHVSEETIRRQERILTRLLNAQKSLRRRDYSRRRKSRPGGEYEVVPPPELSLEEQQRQLQDLIYRKRGYYPPEYEDLIRAYLEAIASPEGRR